MKYNTREEVVFMKKTIIFIVIGLSLFAKGASNSGDNSNSDKGKSTASQKVEENTSEKGKNKVSDSINENKEKKTNNNLRDDIARYNWGQLKGTDGAESKENIKYFGNLTKIMFAYQVSIRNQEEYNKFIEMYLKGELNFDELTQERLRLEFQRYNGLIDEEKYEEELEKLED